VDTEKKQWNKSATLFKAFSNTVARKVVTFKRDKDIQCALNYEVADDSPLPLPKGTDPRIGVFDIKVRVDAYSLVMDLFGTTLKITAKTVRIEFVIGLDLV
jgi:hypothetical protein